MADDVATIENKFDQRLIAQTLSFKEGIATIIRLRMTLYTVEAPSFMEGRMSTLKALMARKKRQFYY